MGLGHYRMRFIDANPFLRFLTRDDEQNARACFALFRQLESGEVMATTSESIVAEIVYVLSSRSVYNLSHTEISQRLQPVLRLRGLKLSRKGVYFRALEVYETHQALDFEDALTVAHMEHDGLTELLSYDRDFDRVPEVKRVEPSLSQ